MNDLEKSVMNFFCLYSCHNFILCTSPPAFIPQTPPASGNQPRFCENPNLQKIVFAKPSPNGTPATLPECLEGRALKEKHPFLFQKKFHPRQIRNARSVFLSGLPPSPRGGGGAIRRAYDLI